MPIDHEIGRRLAENMIKLYTGLEERLAGAIRLEVERRPDPNDLEKLEAIRRMRDNAQRLLKQLDSDTRDEALAAITQAFVHGSREALEEVTGAGIQKVPDWWERRDLSTRIMARLLGFAKRRDADRSAAIRATLDRTRDQLPGVDSIQALAGELSNRMSSTHMQILRWQDDAYRQVVAERSADVLAGTSTQLRAAQVVWERLMSQGVTGFVDKAGRNWQLTSYAEMATRSTVMQATIEAHLARLKEMGQDLVQVSNAPQECSRCRDFEGKILSASGPAGPRRVEHYLTDEPMTIHVTATVAEAIAQGLFHPNCRHRLGAYLPGVTKPLKDTADPAGDAARQHLRALEREVRKNKRLAGGALTPEEREGARIKVKEFQARIREHVANTTAKRQPHREQIPDEPHGRIIDPPKPDPKPKPPPPPPAPEPDPDPDPVVPDAVISDATRAKIDDALASLPADRAGWDAPVLVQGQRRIDTMLADARKELADAQARRDAAVAEVEAEFKAKRTPHARRPDILSNRTRSTEDDLWRKTNRVTELEQYAAGSAASAEPQLKHLYETTDQYRYPKDANGNAIPPAEYQRHLDAVLAVGDAILNDFDDARMYDEEHSQLRKQMLTFDIEHSKAVREQSLLKQLLASIRAMAGHRQRTGTSDGKVRSDWVDLLREAETVYPTDWLKHADDRGPLNAVHSDRAYFLAGAQDKMAFSHVEVDDGTAFSSHNAEVTAHELGHRMEKAIAGLTHLEFAFVYRRSMVDGNLIPAKRMRDLVSPSYGPEEVTHEDQWDNPYAGKTYISHNPGHPAGNAWELFQTAIQDTFGRGHRRYTGLDGQRFVLGVLALLARGDRP